MWRCGRRRRSAGEDMIVSSRKTPDDDRPLVTETVGEAVRGLSGERTEAELPVRGDWPLFFEIKDRKS